MATVAYLREREQVTSVYREVKRSVWLEDDARRRISALTYVVDRFKGWAHSGHVTLARGERSRLADFAMSMACFSTPAGSQRCPAS